MKKFLLLILVIFALFLAVPTAKKTPEQAEAQKAEKAEKLKQKEADKARKEEEKKKSAEQKAQKQKQAEADRARKEEESKKQAEQKAEKQKLAEAEKAKKEEEKKKNAELKLKQKAQKQEEEAKLKEQQEKEKLEEKEKLKVQKQQEKEQQEQQRQANLEAQVKKTCDVGQFLNTEGVCQNCSENCESCMNTQFCDYCRAGQFRVIVEKKVNSYCSTTVPKGYIPNIEKFYLQNPHVQKPTASGKTIAYDGKKAILDTNFELPYQIVQGQPKKGQQFVRVDVIPCKENCKECPEGFLQDNEGGCTTEVSCDFPRSVQTNQQGVKFCQENDPSVLRGFIEIIQKQQQTVSFKARINKNDQVGIQYQWSVLLNGNDVTPSVLNKGNYGNKVKTNFVNYQAGQKFDVKVKVIDSSIQDHQGYFIEQEFVL